MNTHASISHLILSVWKITPGKSCHTFAPRLPSFLKGTKLCDCASLAAAAAPTTTSLLPDRILFCAGGGSVSHPPRARDSNQAPGKRVAFASSHRHSMAATSGERVERRTKGIKGRLRKICFEREGHVGQIYFGSSCYD